MDNRKYWLLVSSAKVRLIAKLATNCWPTPELAFPVQQPRDLSRGTVIKIYLHNKEIYNIMSYDSKMNI